MGRQRDYQARLFEEFEKINSKLDKLLKENKSLVTIKIRSINYIAD